MSAATSPARLNYVTFNVVLHCTETNSTTTGSVQFETPPKTALDIKRAVQSAHSIPTCVQTLTYDSTELQDDDRLDSSLRSGDTFRIAYEAEAKCTEIAECIEWLGTLKKSVEDDKKVSPLGGMSSETSLLVSLGATEGMTDNLSIQFFYPWGDKMKYVNKLHFLATGGLQILTALHALLVNVPWDHLQYKLRYIEYVCVQSIANFSQTFPLRRMAVKEGALDNCVKSLLRKKLVKGEVPTDIDHPNTEALQSTLEVSLYAVCNMSELPECQLLLAQREDVLQNALHISLAPCYTSKLSIVVASFLLCLSQSPDTHPYLSQPDVVGDLLEVCQMRKDSQQQDEHNSIQALNCYTAVVLAQMTLGTPGCISEQFTPAIKTLMTFVIDSVDPVKLRQYEEKEGLIWGTFIPYLNYLYNPTPSSGTELWSLSINILLHILINTLGRRLHVEYLCKEGLLDYTVNLPSVLPVECQALARAVVCELGRHLPLQPPSLSVLTRAKLAKLCFGLETMRGVSSVTQFVYSLCSHK